jgi:hypothetical protein
LLSDIEDILRKNEISHPRDNFPDTSTLRKRFKQPGEKEKIVDAAFGPELEKLGQAVFWYLKRTSKYVSILENGPISKRDLMRRLRGSRKDIDRRFLMLGTVRTSIGNRSAEGARRSFLRSGKGTI